MKVVAWPGLKVRLGDTLVKAKFDPTTVSVMLPVESPSLVTRMVMVELLPTAVFANDNVPFGSTIAAGEAVMFSTL